MKLFLAALLVCIPLASWAQGGARDYYRMVEEVRAGYRAAMPEQMIEKTFVILKSTKDYKEALKTAQSASQLLEVTLDLRGLSENKEIGLTFNEEACQNGAGEVIDPDKLWPCYQPRGREDGMFISIEYSTAFQGFSKGYYIVVLASSIKNDKTVLTALKKAKTHYPDAYTKTTKVYMGRLD